MTTCSKCGGRVIYVKSFRHAKTKKIVVPKKGKVIMIHLDGPCR